MDGNMSQIFYLDFSFHFMESRKISFQKIKFPKGFSFLCLDKTRP